MSVKAITGHTILDIRHLALVLNELQLFGKSNWQKFGLEAGLYHNNLQEIGTNNSKDVDACFRECVASWLKRQNDVDVKGKPTLLRLADIVEETGDKATADEIRKKIKEKDEAIQKDNTTSTSSTAGASQTSRGTEESTFRPDVAYSVMTECTGKIKEGVDLYSLIDNLLEKRIINEKEKNQVTDQSCNMTIDQRKDKLLGLVKASIKEDGEVFRLFIEIIKQENTRRTDRLAQTLLDTYKRLKS